MPAINLCCLSIEYFEITIKILKVKSDMFGTKQVMSSGKVITTFLEYTDFVIHIFNQFHKYYFFKFMINKKFQPVKSCKKK